MQHLIDLLYTSVQKHISCQFFKICKSVVINNLNCLQYYLILNNKCWLKQLRISSAHFLSGIRPFTDHTVLVYMLVSKTSTYKVENLFFYLTYCIEFDILN